MVYDLFKGIIMNSNIKILIIEDEKDIRELIKLQLELQNYHVDEASSANEALSKIHHNSYELILIDRMLPDMSGLTLCQKLREMPQYKRTPIIMVTALSEPQNIIEGLDAGADDYITKPFDISVLHARVRAQLRKFFYEQKESDGILLIHNLSIDEKKCRVKLSDEEITLTNTEFQILLHLAKEPGVVQTRQKLLNSIVGTDIHVTNRTIDTHIAGLRKKLKDSSELIETIRGVGYRLQDND